MQITCMQKEFVQTFKEKNLGKSHELYLKSDTLLLADVSKNLNKMCLNIYHLDP